MRNQKGQFVKGSSGFTGKHTEEAKAKMSVTWFGKKPAWNKDTHLSSQLGKPRPLEVKMKIGQAQKGNKNHAWKGGITPINKRLRKQLEYTLWRTAVFDRDNYTCQECNQRGNKLQAHHIKKYAHYPELRLAIDNGITLCITCHKKTPNYGNKN